MFIGAMVSCVVGNPAATLLATYNKYARVLDLWIFHRTVQAQFRAMAANIFELCLWLQGNDHIERECKRFMAMVKVNIEELGWDEQTKVTHYS